MLAAVLLMLLPFRYRHGCHFLLCFLLLLCRQLARKREGPGISGFSDGVTIGKSSSAYGVSFFL